MTTKVKLRRKAISKGRQSLYLDFYPPIPHPDTGEPTRREFLGLYIFDKPKNELDKRHNEETQKIAEHIRFKRDNSLNKPEIYSKFEKEQLRIEELGNRCFVEYFEELANKRKSSNHDNWMSALNYLKSYTEGSLKFSSLNEKFLEGFKEYLLTTKSKRSNKTTLSQNSAVSYFNKIKATLKQAYKDDILQHDLNAKVKPIKAAETRREYLTLEELNNLVKTPCNDLLLKRAALFSALTGLRFSDIKKMRWNELEWINDEGYFLKFSQQKTKSIEDLPISNQAYQLTEGHADPKQMNQDQLVFEGLKYSSYHNKHQWDRYIYCIQNVRT